MLIAYYTPSIPPMDTTALKATLNQTDFAVSKEGQDTGPMKRWWGWMIIETINRRKDKSSEC